jgi:predicted Kef-type K+ transport protein
VSEVLWLGIAFALGLTARQLGIPSLIGFLLAGFMLSAAGAQAGELLATIAKFGIELLLFSVGLKLRVRSLLRLEVFGSALCHLTISAVLLAPAVHFFAGVAWDIAWLLGISLAFSSTVLAAKVLEKKTELRAFHGRVAIGILIVQDLVAVILLALSEGQAPSPLVVLLLGLPLLRPVLFRVLDLSGHEELLVVFGVVMALLVGGLGFESLRLSPELGALVMGVLLSEHPRAKELHDGLWGLKELFLVGFFLQIGLLGLPTPQQVVIAVALCSLLPLKVGLYFWILTRFKLRARSSFLSALALASYSEFGLIVAHLATERGWLEGDWLTLLALTVAMSFSIAAPLNHMTHRLYQRYAVRLGRWERSERHPDDAPISLGDAHVLIMGMGRVGTGAYDFLRQRNERVVGLDSDPGKIERHLGARRRVLYADSEDPGFWDNLDLDAIGAVMLALPEPEAKRIAAAQLRARGYTGLITATSVYPEESADIAAAGADLTFNYYDEVGVGFAEHVWEAMYPEPEDATSYALDTQKSAPDTTPQ